MRSWKAAIRRSAVWSLILFVGLLPLLATGSRQVAQGRQAVERFLIDYDDIVAAWARPYSGESQSVSTDWRTGVMIRERGLAGYAITQAFQDQPGLYQGTVTTAWPARPAWEGNFRLRLVSEPEVPCREVGRTDMVALDDCR